MTLQPLDSIQKNSLSRPYIQSGFRTIIMIALLNFSAYLKTEVTFCASCLQRRGVH